MRTLSAIDAIGPAWTHAQRLVLGPRSWRLALKLTAVAFFAQLGGCNLNLGGPGGTHGHHLPTMPPFAIAAVIGAVLMVTLVALTVGLALLYLGSRLEFVLFDLVLRRDTVIAPIWRRFGQVTWRWIGLKILFALVVLLCILPIAVPAIIHLIRVFPTDGSDLTSQQMIALFGAILTFGGAVLLIVLLAAAAYALLHDFGLPFLAVENTSLSETCRRVVHLCRAEPGAVFVYLLMRFVLAILGGLAGELALGLGAIVALIPFGGLGFLFWATLHGAGPLGYALMIAAWVLLGIVFLALILLAAILLFGFYFCFLQAYALYFLGGRYPLVGQYLEPLLPLPYNPAAAYPPYIAPAP